MLTSVTAVAAVSVLALSACGQAPDSGSGDKKSDYKVCMVSDAGGWDDHSFNESGKQGFDKAVKEFGLKQANAESKDQSDYSSNVDQMVQQGCKLTYGVGFNLAATMTKAAQQNKDLDFALIDSTFDDAKGKTQELKNGKPLLFNTAEAGYLAGYLAAGYSKSGKIGTFGGQQIPSVTVFMDGYYDGVQKFNKDNKKDVKLLGWNKDTQKGAFANSFDDQGKGKTLAQQFLDQGADVILPVAGPVNLGAAAAVKKAGDGATVVWTDSDGYESAADYKDIILTSTLKEISTAVYDTAKQGKDKKFDGTPYIGTLKNGGVGIADYHDFDSKIDDGLKKKVADLKKQIVDGKISVDSKNSPTK